VNLEDWMVEAAVHSEPFSEVKIPAQQGKTGKIIQFGGHSEFGLLRKRSVGTDLQEKFPAQRAGNFTRPNREFVAAMREPRRARETTGEIAFDPR
jgi:hypothetical protein